MWEVSKYLGNASFTGSMKDLTKKQEKKPLSLLILPYINYYRVLKVALLAVIQNGTTANYKILDILKWSFKENRRYENKSTPRSYEL